MKYNRQLGWLLSGTSLLATTMLLAVPSLGQEQGQFFATQEDGFGRIVLRFPDREDLPPYDLKMNNGVLSIAFEEPVSLVLPDVAGTLPDYFSVARVDGDGMGVRLGLRSSLNFNRTEAGDRLFIDLLPPDWQGLPPALPDDIVAEMEENARKVTLRADQERKAQVVAEQNPVASVRVGRNPTFMRVQFDWTIPTTASFVQDGELGSLSFEWPVPVDLRTLQTDLPAEIVSLTSEITLDGTMVDLKFARGVTPRFYSTGPTQQVLDIDISGEPLPELALSAVEHEVAAVPHVAGGSHEGETSAAARPVDVPETIAPYVTMLGNTVRVVFPFAQDTPAAVFRRGDAVWMVFDSHSRIVTPTEPTQLDAIASAFVASSSDDTQTVRIDLSQDRLATLGTEGTAWVLSLGDVMVAPTEPMALSRRRDFDGTFEMFADVQRPGRVHKFVDGLVGDHLELVTAYPPARGVTRRLDYVDFSALASVHGLVLQPKTESLAVELENALAVISADDGLTLTAMDTLRHEGGSVVSLQRASFIDLLAQQELNPAALQARRIALEAAAAGGEGAARDNARLELASFLLANQLDIEALGVIAVMRDRLENESLLRKLDVLQAAAEVSSGRARDALPMLNRLAEEADIDALFWRAMARAQLQDFNGAQDDAKQARIVAETYPDWARNRFLMSGARAAVEQGDASLAQRFLDELVTPGMSEADLSNYYLLHARIDEKAGRAGEAIDTYGQVIAMEIRPTRAEAVYRTLQMLDDEGRLDVSRGIATLAGEAMLWRGDALEADMQAMLADLYFRSGQYRQGFEAVRDAVASGAHNPTVQGLSDRAQLVFSDLFLNGMADALDAVEALGIYYDFQQLTPPGARGDEMIRNLARRLVRVDLLPQAAELLQYQLDQRLTGIARAQVAADLAVIYLADHRPSEALAVLNQTRLPDMPGSLTRQRRLLEARSMIDGGRDQLALDLLGDMTGRDAEVMRIEAHWRAQRYSEAGAMLEALYAIQPGGEPLSADARVGILQAGVGYVLGNDRTGAARLRAKFAEAMSVTPEWGMFDYITSQIEASSLEFRQVASQVASITGLESFLSAYRDSYAGEGALTPEPAGDAPVGDLASAE